MRLQSYSLEKIKLRTIHMQWTKIDYTKKYKKKSVEIQNKII